MHFRKHHNRILYLLYEDWTPIAPITLHVLAENDCLLRQILDQPEALILRRSPLRIRWNRFCWVRTWTLKHRCGICCFPLLWSHRRDDLRCTWCEHLHSFWVGYPSLLRSCIHFWHWEPIHSQFPRKALLFSMLLFSPQEMDRPISISQPETLEDRLVRLTLEIVHVRLARWVRRVLDAWRWLEKVCIRWEISPSR